MFSSRIPFTHTPNALTALLDARRRASLAVLDLTVSNPTHAGLAYPEASILAALTDARALRYEPDPRGLLRAREAVTGYYRDTLAVDVPPDRVLLTASTSEAYALLFKLLCDPGDRVLIPRPSYPLFEYLASLESVHVDTYALGYDGTWYLDVDAVARGVTPATRAVVVVNPNNPTGSFLKRDELDALCALCSTRGLALISDEVFADYAFAPDARRAPTVAAERTALCFALGGLSKACGLPQMKLAWIAAAGAPAVRDEALARLELIADTYLSVGAPVQHAAPALLAARGSIRDAIAARTHANRAHALAAVAGSAGHFLHAEGGWYMVLRVPATQREEQWALELLERDGVLVHPGYFFDFAGEAFLVLSLLTPEDDFREGLARILSRVRAHAG